MKIIALAALTAALVVVPAPAQAAFKDPLTRISQPSTSQTLACYRKTYPGFGKRVGQRIPCPTRPVIDLPGPWKRFGLR